MFIMKGKVYAVYYSHCFKMFIIISLSREKLINSKFQTCEKVKFRILWVIKYFNKCTFYYLPSFPEADARQPQIHE